ncbi:MAG TPA: pyrimidine dimer DNA glycosylase/endonuclease V [Rhodanobacteraceae bacterium]|jgi:hypothetical protein|nr:pyrimidine dimer DNA glycosylase/endonuclease V [Rhodanobacteraceae bacterium]
MRLWSLHPRYLDSKGLTAAWREALLARAVMAGQTRGYRAHPQLIRFERCAAPLLTIESYLHGLLAEAQARGFEFDAGKVSGMRTHRRLTVTRGQLAFEVRHLREKLRVRDPGRLRLLPRSAIAVETHPLFRVVPGAVAAWERGEGR